MSKLLVCGVCPLPFENTNKNYGPGIRSWQFASSLAGAGHEVQLACMTTGGVYEQGRPAPSEERDGVHVHRLHRARFLNSGAIKGLVERFRPDAVVGATVYGSFALARQNLDLPFWADQFGHVMAEAQAKAALELDNWPLPFFWAMVQPVMSRADKISTVSNRQRYAAMGELGALGRLNAETCGYEFTAVVPCAVMLESDGRLTNVVRGVKAPRDAFIVLWSGGFNVWSDVETLFEGIDTAMQRCPKLHFVSTGGEIIEQDSKTYGRFSHLVGGSPRRDRFHLEGWVRRELVSSYVAEADVGILTELPIYEGLLGSKNRIIQWMGAGLPVICNPAGDLGELFAERDLGLTFEMGDPEGLAGQILWSVEHAEALRATSERARAFALQECSVEHTTRDLRDWAQEPHRAPDAETRRRIQSPYAYTGLHHAIWKRAVRIGSRFLPSLRPRTPP